MFSFFISSSCCYTRLLDVFISRPSSLLARASSGHHNTENSSWNSATHGTVSCVTEVWGGREGGVGGCMSDKHLNESYKAAS